jgi:flagellar assembly protein FliH
MSRIINCESHENCKPWRAPNIGDSNDNSYDFKEFNPGNINHREQQEKTRQQSYEKSFAKGYMEGLAQGQKEIQQQVQNLSSLMASLAMPLPDLDNQVVDELVQLSMAVVRQMVRRELKISPGEIVAVVREALSLLPVAAAEITLELHPEDAKLIRENLVHPEATASWNIVEDALLTRGGCRVLTNTSRIDATVEKRMNTVIAEVMGGERKVDFRDDD